VIDDVGCVVARGSDLEVGGTGVTAALTLRTVAIDCSTGEIVLDVFSVSQAIKPIAKTDANPINKILIMCSFIRAIGT
tara:strand:- start:314 stop:547 length:234 start_codon:yes stop_codon:yes gene_type:complete